MAVDCREQVVGLGLFHLHLIEQVLHRGQLRLQTVHVAVLQKGVIRYDMCCEKINITIHFNAFKMQNLTSETNIFKIRNILVHKISKANTAKILLGTNHFRCIVSSSTVKSDANAPKNS